MSFWEMAYKYGWASKEQLQEAVVLGELTQEEFDSIVA